MRYLLKALAPLKAHQVSDSALDSVRSLVKNVIVRSRIILRSFFSKQDEISHSSFRLQLRLPELTEKIVVGSGRSTLFQQQQRFNRFIYRPGFLHRATARWPTNSLAATLRRNAGRRLFQGTSGPILAFVGFSMAKKPSLLTEKEELEGLFYEVRDVFASVPYDPVDRANSSIVHKIAKLQDLKIGCLLAKGCNAAVYSAYCKNRNIGMNFGNTSTATGKIFISHSEPEFLGNKDGLVNSPEESPPLTDEHSSLSTGKLSPYDLALKVMFNYNAESNASAILKAMHKETLPSIMDTPFSGVFAHNKCKKKLPPHPNIVEMYCSFADMQELLPEAFNSYPQALPTRLLESGYGRNMTLFLVMKRYHCSLKEYLKEHEPMPRISTLLLVQLLEGLAHLLQHNIAHRDLKTDNILLDLTYGVTNPLLVITDFGCCLENLTLPLQTDEVDRGGNMALMAPEVVMAVPGPFTTIDYSRSDLWTIGCLAYEIFGTANPFCSERNQPLMSSTYTEDELPPLPPSVPIAIKKLVPDMLCRDPRKRPSPTVAATVCQLLLHAPLGEMFHPSGEVQHGKLAQWICQMSSETYFKAIYLQQKQQSLEYLLSYTFCSRIQFSDLVQALHYL